MVGRNDWMESAYLHGYAEQKKKDIYIYTQACCQRISTEREKWFICRFHIAQINWKVSKKENRGVGKEK